MNQELINLQPILEKIGGLVKAEAIRMCPVDMGELRRSIDYRVDGDTVVLFALSDHATDMEYGRPPSPLSDMEKGDFMDSIDSPTVHGWAKRHKANAKGVIWSLEHRGIKVGTPEKPLHITSYGRDSYRPFLRPAVYKNMSKIRQIIRDEVKRQQ